MKELTLEGLAPLLSVVIPLVVLWLGGVFKVRDR